MLFMFAGSAHTKYATYLLEFITNFELESSKELQETVLNAMVVNLSGKEGGFAAGDIIQEFFNRLLEAIIQCKGAQFGEPFVHNVISQNLHHMGHVKWDLWNSIGLSPHSGRHSDPHTWLEVKTLLQVYAEYELHSWWPGRSIDGKDVLDDFTCGWERLAKGKIRKWVVETTHARAMWAHASAAAADKSNIAGSTGNDRDMDWEDGNEEADEEADENPQVHAASASTLGSMSFVNGQFVIEALDPDGIAQSLMDEMEVEDSEDEHNDELGSWL